MHINTYTFSHTHTHILSLTHIVLHPHTLWYSHKLSQLRFHPLTNSHTLTQTHIQSHTHCAYTLTLSYSLTHTLVPHTCIALRLKGVEKRAVMGRPRAWGLILSRLLTCTWSHWPWGTSLTSWWNVSVGRTSKTMSAPNMLNRVYGAWRKPLSHADGISMRLLIVKYFLLGRM